MSDGYVLREDGGSIEVTPGALAQIVQRAVESVDGARVRRPRRGLDLRLDDSRAHVELELAARYGVLSMPTFMLFDHGRPVTTLIGARPRRRLEQELDAALQPVS